MASRSVTVSHQDDAPVHDPTHDPADGSASPADNSGQRALVGCGISKSFTTPSGTSHKVLQGISLRINAGAIVGLRGPSGVGKSTLGRILAGLETADSGECYCDGIPVLPVRTRAGKEARGRIGMIFQSPRRSCDPRVRLRTAIASVARPGIDIHALAASNGLSEDLLKRFPHQVSDGQLQRVAVTRTLAACPRYIICDEMTAMLDPANSAAIVGVLRNFAASGGGVLMISHDHHLLDAVCEDIIDLATVTTNPD